MNVTYSGCVFVALVIQHEMGMRRPILLFMVFLHVPCFPALPHKRHRLSGKKIIEHKMCVLVFSTTSL